MYLYKHIGLGSESRPGTIGAQDQGMVTVSSRRDAERIRAVVHITTVWTKARRMQRAICGKVDINQFWIGPKKSVRDRSCRSFRWRHVSSRSSRQERRQEVISALFVRAKAGEVPCLRRFCVSRRLGNTMAALEFRHQWPSRIGGRLCSPATLRSFP